MTRFKMPGGGDVWRVLGTQVSRDIQAGSLVIAQEDCTRGLVAEYRIQDCRPLGTTGGKARSYPRCSRKRAFPTRRQSGDFKLLSAAPCASAR